MLFPITRICHWPWQGVYKKTSWSKQISTNVYHYYYKPKTRAKGRWGRNEFREQPWQWNALLPSYSCTLGFSVDELFTPEVGKLINFPLCVPSLGFSSVSPNCFALNMDRYCSQFNVPYKAQVPSDDSEPFFHLTQLNLLLVLQHSLQCSRMVKSWASFTMWAT